MNITTHVAALRCIVARAREVSGTVQTFDEVRAALSDVESVARSALASPSAATEKPGVVLGPWTDQRGESVGKA